MIAPGVKACNPQYKWEFRLHSRANQYTLTVLDSIAPGVEAYSVQINILQYWTVMHSVKACNPP